MSPRSVLLAMESNTTCEHTGLSKPECCCRPCHLEQLRTFAPRLQLKSHSGLNLSAPLIPLERYAAERGLTVSEVKREAANREVIC